MHVHINVNVACMYIIILAPYTDSCFRKFGMVETFHEMLAYFMVIKIQSMSHHPKLSDIYNAMLNTLQCGYFVNRHLCGH